MCRRKCLITGVFVMVCVVQGVLVGYFSASDQPPMPIQLSDGRVGHNSNPYQLKQNELKSSEVSDQLLNNIQLAKDQSCSDEVCTSLLQLASRKCYKLCQQLAFLRTEVPSSDIPKRCKFRDGMDHVPVALVSVPGSGNTWIRGLLEKATGICTGSIYCDAPLRNQGFVGEYVHDGSVLVVKTHTSDYQWHDVTLEKRNHEDALYGSAILLIRNPFDTFVAERHRSSLLKMYDQTNWRASNDKDSSHVYKLSKEAFGNNSDWSTFIDHISSRWQKTVTKWSTSNHSVLVVRYEDLKKDSLTQVVRMLDFLDHSYNRAELEVELRGGFRDFQRNHTDEYDHYTKEQKIKINAIITQTIDILTRHKLDNLFQLRGYLVTIEQ